MTTTLSYALRDKRGNDTRIGDKIRATLPGIEIGASREYDTDGNWYLEPGDFYADQREIEGTLHFQLSRGLVVKVEKVSEFEGDFKNGKPYTYAGQWLQFKQKAWEWHRINGGTPKEFTYKLIDKYKNICSFGDTIRVVLPRHIVAIEEPPSESTEPWEDVWVGDTIVEGVLHFQLSQGAIFRVLKVIRDCPNRPGYVKPGKVYKFRRKWDWCKVFDIPDSPWNIEFDDTEGNGIDSPYHIDVPPIMVNVSLTA
jgi:hypothetical protein